MVALGIGSLQAATPYPAGFTLVNSTPNIISWTVPNDGAQHRVLVLGEINVTSGETGGAIKVAITDPGGTAHNFTISPGGSGAGGVQLSPGPLYLVQAGSTVTVAQSSALSVGAAVIWCEIWGS